MSYLTARVRHAARSSIKKLKDDGLVGRRLFGQVPVLFFDCDGQLKNVWLAWEKPLDNAETVVYIDAVRRRRPGCGS